MKKKDSTRPSGKKILLTVICILLAIILAVVLALTFYAKHLLNQINYVDKETESYLSSEEVEQFLATEETEDLDPTLQTLIDDDLDWGENTTQIGQTENIINILLIGQDARDTTTRSRSDSMILVTVNKEKRTITLTSFLRDLYVQIPDYGNSKLNHTYSWGGFSLLNTTLENNFGIHVDGNLEVNFARFAQLIDLLGGVDIELRADEAANINGDVSGSALVAGMQHLNGAQALDYARIRSLDLDSDFSRTNRQRKVIISLFNKFKDSDVTTMMNLMEEALPMLTTDMSQEDIVGYAAELLPILSEFTIISQRVPADGEYYCARVHGMSVVKADMDAARKLLEDTLGTDNE